jgi:transaldolase
MSVLIDLRRLGQSVWLDNLSRTHLHEGSLARLIEAGVSGITSNPTIFHKAVSESPYYKDDLDRLKHTEPDPERRYEALVVEDIRAACDLFRPVHEASQGDDGYVSLEVAPRLAHDTAGTVSEARRLANLVGRDNVLIKVPGTPAGVEAFERLTAEGVRVNVTLLFSLQHVVRVFEAYIRGAKRWLAAGGEPARLKAVASLFLSRVDTLANKRLDALATPEAMHMRGKTAVAMARLAYQRYKDLFHGAAFAELKAAGVRPQYLLWASSGTKNPAYSDLLYVEPLMGPETINTLPDKTLEALLDHGQVAARLEQGVADAEAHLVRLEHLGIFPADLGEELQQEGVRLFAASYDQLLALMQ